MLELIGARVESAASCCEVFGCREESSGLGDVCLTELALARGGRAREFVVEVPERAGRGVVVTAIAFDQGPTRSVLFAVRPVAGGETTARPRNDSTIRIRTLGETVLSTAEGDLRDGWLDHRAGRLLKFLIANRYTPMHADVIAEALWPRARADTTNTVRHFVHALREKLEPARAPYERSTFVVARNGGYMLNPACVAVDADDYERAAKAGLIALAGHERERAGDELRHAIELYQGDFLADERFEDWAMAERERLRHLATRCLRGLADLAGDTDQAADYLERLAEMEPLDVDIHRELIAAWLRQGRRGRAIRHFRALQSRLMRELGERVDFDLVDLIRTAARGEERSQAR
jgi:DNA-binding SARP family transcriptional activator